MQFFSTIYRTPQFCLSGLILVILTFLSSVCTAQKDFNGAYTINTNLTGTAHFEFFIKETDTVKSGNFIFESDPISSEKGHLEFKFYKGYYIEGQKSGNWIYRHYQLNPEQAATIENYKLVREITGKEFIVSASFEQGIPNGQWTAVERNFQNSKITDTLLYISGAFKNGILFGSFKGETPEFSIDGQFTADGYANGEWKMNHFNQEEGEQLIEYRKFNNGIFSDHFFDYKGQQRKVSYAGINFGLTDQSDLLTVPFDSTRLEHLQYLLISGDVEENNPKLKNLSSERLKSALDKTNNITSRLLRSFANFNSQNIWSTPNDETVEFNFGKLRVPEKEWADDLLKNLGNAKRKCKEAQNIISNFTKNPTIQVGIYSYRNLKYYSSVFEIYSINLQKLNDAIDILSINSIQHIKLSEAIDLILDSPEFPDSVDYQFKNEKFTESYFKPTVSHNQHPILFLEEYVSKLNKEIIIIEERVSEIVEHYQKQGQLAENENRLVSKRDSIIMLYQNAQSDKNYNQFHQELSDGVINFVNSLFQDYAGLSLENKVNVLDRTTDCLNEYLILYEQVIRIPLRMADIESLYTRVVWNPYTYTDMNERVKERLYRTYETRLLPLIWSELKQNIHCDDVRAYASNYEKVYQRMLQLREQDTKEIEKDLKKTSSIPEVLSILSLDLVISDR